jgi:hypothetical protein
LAKNENRDRYDENKSGNPAYGADVVEINSCIASPSVSFSLDVIFGNLLVRCAFCVLGRRLIDMLLRHKVPIGRRQVEVGDVSPRLIELIIAALLNNLTFVV